ncbi:Pex19 protein family-domain-containing protein [Trametes maxima]|nr:Pex19 protein family-domain-containing protein [Trametes maxima]
MAAPRKPTVEDEDLDDLDDVLEQFSAPPKPPAAAQTSPAPPAPQTTTTKATQPASQAQKTPDPFGLDGLDDDFARELTKGMESLFRDIAQGAGLEGAPSTGAEDGDEERERAFRAAWEAMLVEGMNGTMSAEDVLGAGAGDGTGKEKGKGVDAGAVKEGGGPSVASGAGADSFQESIRKAMDKMKESSQKADEASGKGGDAMADLFSRMAGDADSVEGEEDLKGLLENMMSQLMSKEVLYEPLKELHDKFPSYLQDNAAKLSAADKSRYESQRAVVAQIVATFEDASYSDDDPEKSLKVIELMQKMQDYGSPPSEIMGPLPPGFDLGADGLPQLPDGCTIA